MGERMRIEDILEKYERASTLHGTEPVKAPLLRDLEAQKQSTNRIYGIFFAVVCLVTVISVSAVVVDLISDHKSRILLLSAAGIPIPFMLNFMRRTAAQWSQLTLLITLVSHSDEKAIQSLISKLVSSKSIGFTG
jgi:hypothetical protein